MDRSLAALERAWREGRDLDAARELARARLRAGRPRAALTLARVCDDALREEAAVELARGLTARLEPRPRPDAPPTLVVESLSNVEVFRLGDRVLHLIPGGRFLDERGTTAETSLVGPGGGQRAPLAPVDVPDLLVARQAEARAMPLVARAAARALGGRLLRPPEWKKAWRGGLFLDGDETELLPNPTPERISPEVPSVAPPYGLHFAPRAWEHVEGELVAMGFLAGRYQVATDSPDARRGRDLVWRLVLELAQQP